MGKTGVVIFGVVVGLACVTTAIALTSSAAAYFSELCRGKVRVGTAIFGPRVY